MNKLNDEYDKLKFEDAMRMLEDTVKKLEKGDVTLEESLELFTLGMRLSTVCNQKISEMEGKIAILTSDSNGKYTEEEM